jgi:hypothetical protein
MERKLRFSHKIDILTPQEIEGMRKVCKVLALSSGLADKVVGKRGA